MSSKGCFRFWNLMASFPIVASMLDDLSFGEVQGGRGNSTISKGNHSLALGGEDALWPNSFMVSLVFPCMIPLHNFKVVTAFQDSVFISFLIKSCLARQLASLHLDYSHQISYLLNYLVDGLLDYSLWMLKWEIPLGNPYKRSSKPCKGLSEPQPSSYSYWRWKNTSNNL